MTTVEKVKTQAAHSDDVMRAQIDALKGIERELLAAHVLMGNAAQGSSRPAAQGCVSASASVQLAVSDAVNAASAAHRHFVNWMNEL